MHARKRVKRDSVENLYKACRAGGDCIPDVKNKVENTTLADILLQAFGSIIYLGHLGIGSGKGTGSITTGRPVPEVTTGAATVKPTITKPSRPFSVPIDPLSAGRPIRPIDPLAGSRPVDVLDPSSSAIVPLSENVPDTIVTIENPAFDINIDVSNEITPFQIEPTVVQEGDAAIINVTPIEPPPTTIIYTDPTIENIGVATHIDPDINVFVNPLERGDTISLENNGLEYIPLEDLTTISQFEIEEPPTTSTPSNRLDRAITRARDFYNRRIAQVSVRNPDFLGQVSRAVRFEFENPAFEDEVTLEFEQDLENVEAAPDPDFADIRRLSRPSYNITNEGTLRVSRLGSKGTIRTRSGTVIGQQVHFYYDVSEIPEATAIEMQVLGEFSGEASHTNLLAESSIIDALTESHLYPEEELLDNMVESFNSGQLLLQGEEEDGSKFTYPILYEGVPLTNYVNMIDSSLTFAAPVLHTDDIIQPNIIPFNPLQPGVSIDVISEDYFLHPSLLPKKRKRHEIF